MLVPIEEVNVGLKLCLLVSDHPEIVNNVRWVRVLVSGSMTQEHPITVQKRQGSTNSKNKQKNVSIDVGYVGPEGLTQRVTSWGPC